MRQHRGGGEWLIRDDAGRNDLTYHNPISFLTRQLTYSLMEVRSLRMPYLTFRGVALIRLLQSPPNHRYYAIASDASIGSVGRRVVPPSTSSKENV